MDNKRNSILIVGEGGIPKDFPRNDLYAYLILKSKIECGINLTEEESEIFENLNNKLKKWNRNFRNDEYFHSLFDLQKLIFNKTRTLTEIAFLEYCEPDLYEAIETLHKRGVKKIVLISPLLVLSKEKEDKIIDILNFFKLKYENLNIINFCSLDYNILTNFYINLIKEALDDK